MAASAHPLLRIWAAWLLPAAAWALHLSLSYGLAGWVCAGGPMLVLHAITVSAVLLALLGVGLSWWNLRAVQSADTGLGAVGGSRFLAIAGLLLGLLFVAAILVQAIPPILLGQCR